MMKKQLSLFALVALVAASIPSVSVAQSNCRATASNPTYQEGASAPLSCELDGTLRTSAGGGGGGTVDQGTGNGGSSPWSITGTVAATQSGGWTVGITGTVAATQSGTWTVQPGNTANTTPWLMNIGQWGSNNVLAGNGATGTGSPRVTLSNDNTAVANWGLGTVGSAAPTGAQMAGVRSGANMVQATQANASAAISGNSAATAQLVALSASAVIHVTSFDFIAAGSANVTLVYGTGTNCGTGTTSLTGAYPLTAQAGIAKGNGQGPVLVVPAGNALCWTNSAAVQVSGSVSYTQFVP